MPPARINFRARGGGGEKQVIDLEWAKVPRPILSFSLTTIITAHNIELLGMGINGALLVVRLSGNTYYHQVLEKGL